MERIKEDNFERVSGRLTFDRLSLLTFMLIGFFMMSCTANGQQKGSDSKHQVRPIQKRIENSPQFYNGKFHNNIANLYDAGAAWRASLKELLFGNNKDLTPNQPLSFRRFTGKDLYQHNNEAVRFSRLGHSTLLIQIGKKVWLTDPMFSDRVSLFQWIGPKRFHPVPITIEELPPIEGALISHNHYDHLDHDSIEQLKDRVKHFYVPLGVGEKLISWGVKKEKITELDWWEKKQVGNVELVSTPAQHFSGRGLFDTGKTLWTSWVIKTPQHSVYISGDSGYFDGFQEIGEKYGPFDLAFLECGAYHESWRSMHMMPEDNLKAIKDLKGKILVPIHNGTFSLAFHPWYEPMEEVMKLSVKEKNIKLLIPVMGEIIDINNIPETIEWWNRDSKN